MSHFATVRANNTLTKITNPMKLKLTIPHESKIALFAGAATICMLIQIIGLIWGFMQCPNVIRLPFIVIGGLGCFIVDAFIWEYLKFSTFKR